MDWVQSKADFGVNVTCPKGSWRLSQAEVDALCVKDQSLVFFVTLFYFSILNAEMQVLSA